MNLQEHIRKVLREESISVNMKTVQSDLINMIGPSKIKIVNTIGSFNSSFKIIVDHLDQEILDKINNYMNENGWFPHSIGLSDMKERRYSQNVKNYIGEDDVQIGYESKTPEGINTTQTKAFHVTPDIFLDKIMETGLTLKSEGKLSDHPNRIYLFLNGDKNTQKGIVWAIWNSLSKERQETIKNYYVLEIDLTQIPNHKIYRDPQAFITYEAVYVDQPIPKSAIKVIDRIDTSNIETENDIDMTKEEEKIARDEKKRKEEESIEQQKNSDLTYDQFEKSVNKLPDNLKNMNIDDLMNLQEHIRRIIREELYSPSCDEHIPSRFVVHKSNPVWRENIELTGLQISVGECYQQHVGGDVECKKSIFATDSSNKKDWFDSTYDDDIWLIDTECAGVTWYKDRHFDFSDHNYHIVTFEDISPDCLKLIYKGTGSGDVKKWDKDSPNIVRESIKKVLKEETRFNKMGEEKYKSCSMSDITRMELIDTFLTNTEKDPQFNLEEPNYDMLIDDWDGYDDQVYIQNQLDKGKIIFYEGWVDNCWKAIKTKPEYNGMNKKEVIDSIITKRFPRIAEEFNMIINDYGYFNNGNGYIMYIVFKSI